MMLVAGLGNPGEKYKSNRHNAGFLVVDGLAKSLDLAWEYNKKLNSDIAQDRARGFILLKPQTFMNDSGEAVSRALNFFDILPSALLVIHDDVDLEALQFKVSHSASSAGHHGVQDVIDKLGTQDFTRLRIGIGRPLIQSDNVEKYVLQDFPSDELEVVRKQGIEHLLSSLNL